MTQFSLELAQQLLNSTEQFPVSLDDAWKWIGYVEKRNALDTIKSYFEENTDYTIFVLEDKSDNHAGLSPQEKAVAARRQLIYLTVDCFKELGMLAKTDKGREIRRYFIECEKIAKQSLIHTQNITPLLESIASIQLQLSELTVQKEYVDKLQADKDALVQEQKEFDKAAHEHKGCADIILDTIEFGDIDDITMTTLQFIEAKGIEKRHRKRLANLAANFQRCGKNTNDIPKEKGQLLLEVRYLKQAAKVVLGLD